mmetsp:Transcript_55791/g.77386  ORF Transcript_55791/g.77386 Transcript_55791/m.77386 type:complete len:82 (-) Transcript_55791:222-467(-)
MSSKKTVNLTETPEMKHFLVSMPEGLEREQLDFDSRALQTVRSEAEPSLQRLSLVTGQWAKAKGFGSPEMASPFRLRRKTS